MLFNSLDFLIFLPIVVGVYYIIPKKYSNFWLLVASYYFYMSWNAIYALLILFSTFTTWLCAGVMTKNEQNAIAKKSALTVNILLNVGILFTFKYYGMFTTAITNAFSSVGMEVVFPALTLLLPVGISFYTFQALGYSIDVYRNTVKHEKNFLDYALFVSFFPQLVAGPIERSANFLPQIKKYRFFDYENFKIGGRLMLLGYFKKVAVADNLAILVDKYYANSEIWPAPLAVLTLVAFSAQVYFDFAAYSDIARGCAKILGIDLMKNFNHPYCSTSFSMFWTRWHISLSSWLQDYIFTPLVWSRWTSKIGLLSKITKDKPPIYSSLLIVFLISGLWHGAAWTFVVWGALQGIFRIGETILKKKFKSSKDKKEKTPKFVKQLIVFSLWTLSLIFFRSPTIMGAVTVFEGLAVGWGSLFNIGLITEQILELFGSVNALIGIVVSVTAICIIECIEVKTNKDFHELFSNKSFAYRWAVYYVLLFLIVAFGAFEQSSFIYFQF